MCKRIITDVSYPFAARRDAERAEGTNWDLIRVYGEKPIYGGYAVIIADDNLFEGL